VDHWEVLSGHEVEDKHVKSDMQVMLTEHIRRQVCKPPGGLERLNGLDSFIGQFPCSLDVFGADVAV